MASHRIFFGVVGDESQKNKLSLSLVQQATNRIYPDVQFTIHKDKHLIACSSYWQKLNKTTAASGVAIKNNGHHQAIEWEMVASHPELYEGTFAAISVNQHGNQATLVRDPFGIHSVYYTIAEGNLWFADDIRLLCEIQKKFPINQLCLIEWMHYGLPVAPYTFFEKIYVLEAGAKLIFQIQDNKSNISVEKYFHASNLIDAKKYHQLTHISPIEVENSLEQTLEQSIIDRVQGRSGVTVLLSGGVDSSLVVALANKHTDVNAVTVDIVGADSESEVQYARKVANHIGVPIKVFAFNEQVFNEAFCRAIYMLGTPIIIENSVALIAAALHGAFPCDNLLLDGEGSDALNYGSIALFKYSLRTYMIHKITGLPNPMVRKGLEKLRSLLHRWGLATKTCIDDNGLDVMLGGGKMKFASINDELEKAYCHLSGPEKEMAVIRTRELYDYLVPMMLRLDRTAAYSNLDLMMPFCDRNFAGFVLNLPLHHRIHCSVSHPNPTAKYLLKKVAARYIPNEVIYRKKGGFHIPGGIWANPFPSVWLKDSWIGCVFRLKSSDLRSWIDSHSRSRDRMYLASIEIWGRLFDWKAPIEEVEHQWVSGK